MFLFAAASSTVIYSLSLHDALPIFCRACVGARLSGDNSRRSSRRGRLQTHPCCRPLIFIQTHLSCLVARKLWPAQQLGSRRSEEHTSELQSLRHLVCRLLLEQKK